jgi:hypothetical protein
LLEITALRQLLEEAGPRRAVDAVVMCHASVWVRARQETAAERSQQSRESREQRPAPAPAPAVPLQVEQMPQVPQIIADLMDKAVGHIESER